MDGITLSNGEHRGERARSRRYARLRTRCRSRSWPADPCVLRNLAAKSADWPADCPGGIADHDLRRDTGHHGRCRVMGCSTHRCDRRACQPSSGQPGRDCPRREASSTGPCSVRHRCRASPGPVRTARDRGPAGHRPPCARPWSRLPAGQGVIAIAIGTSPTLIGLSAVLVAVRIGVTVPEPELAT